jgi:hypothetical protein
MALKPELLNSVPAKRLVPIDGMAVTARVWEEAHDYHRQQQRLHAMLQHGAGIVAGLEVLASDPPDNAVYILPGIAVDGDGQTIVMTEPLSFDLGRTEGQLFLRLTYGESRPRADAPEPADGAALYVRAEYGMEAVPTLTDGAGVELARLIREGRGLPVTNARDLTRPRANEIDLRYRQHVGAALPEIVSLGVAHVGGAAGGRHGRGLGHVARHVRFHSDQKVWVDEGVRLTAGLNRYALIYLVASGFWQPSAEEARALADFRQAGGTILFESCRHDLAGGPTPADNAFVQYAASLGARLDDVPRDHWLLTEPHLFSAPPAGYETQGVVKMAEGLIFSAYDYGCLWQAEQRAGPPSREAVRAALEWGANLVSYAAARRAEGRQAGEPPA